MCVFIHLVLLQSNHRSSRLHISGDEAINGVAFSKVVRNRRSADDFVDTCIPFNFFMKMLSLLSSSSSPPLPPLNIINPNLLDHLLIGILVLNVEGLSPGVYVFDMLSREEKERDRIMRETFRGSSEKGFEFKVVGDTDSRLYCLMTCTKEEAGDILMNIMCGKKSTRRSSYTLFMFGKIQRDDEGEVNRKRYKDLLQASGVLCQALYLEATAYHLGSIAMGKVMCYVEIKPEIMVLTCDFISKVSLLMT